MGWITWNRHAITGWIWLGMLIPILLWWRESILLVLINAVYTTFKTDMGAHHALHAEKEAKEVSDG